jgi:hypothetical protein
MYRILGCSKGAAKEESDVRLIIVSFLVLSVFSAHALDQIFSQTDVDLTGESQIVANPGFDDGDGVPREEGDGVELAEWEFWQAGYELAPGAGRDGSRAIRCTGDDPDIQHGAGQQVELNQEKPHPFIATGWSRAQDVSGSPNSDYSIYLDFIYQDGTTWWGQTANFSTGTHDWEERRFVVVPQKPIKHVFVHAIFRRHTGTVFFDDFSVLELRGDTYMFEGVAVKPQPTRAPVEKVWIPYMETKNGLQMALERDRARVCGLWVNQEKVGLSGPGFFVRDVGAQSDFLAPWQWKFKQDGSSLTLTGEIEDLDVELAAVLTTRPDYIDVQGVIKSTNDDDRALTVYFGLPVDGDGWLWCHDPRSTLPATASIYKNESMTGAGATGSRAAFPLAAICRKDLKRGVALGVPFDKPRHNRFGLDARTGLFYVAFDFGLNKSATKTPGQATFHFVIFPFRSSWRFRGALSAYYELFPHFFNRRSPRGGLWLPNTNVSTIEGAEDFNFAFHHTRNNIGLQPQPNIFSFVYTDPANVWVPLEEGVTRDLESAAAALETATNGNQQAAEVAMASGILHPTGERVANIVKTPWCDGSVFAVNADPDLPGATAKGPLELGRIESRMSGDGSTMLQAWLPIEAGYAIDDKINSEGSQSLRLDVSRGGSVSGAVQRVQLDQTSPQPLLLRASVRTKGLKEKDEACFLSVALTDTEGNELPRKTYVIEEARNSGTAELPIQTSKPIAKAMVQLVLRHSETASAWFDDVYFGSADGTANLLKDPGMEGELVSVGGIAGAYIESLGSWWNTINYNEAHFASADIPLVYDTHTHRIGILTDYSNHEFLVGVTRMLRKEGKLVMAGRANPYVDVVATTSKWCRNGFWNPGSDRSLLAQRAMAYQKPICTVLNANFESLNLEPIPRGTKKEEAEKIVRKPSMQMTEWYLKRALFYGFYPSMHSEDGSSNPFFEDPKLYNAARPLFKKYLPLIDRLADAGWEPITGAHASSDLVYVERYGNASQGQVYIAATYADLKWRSQDEQGQAVEPAATATIDLNMAYVGFLGEEVELHDLLNDVPVEIKYEQSHVSYPIELLPNEIHLVRVRPTGTSR